MLTARIIVLLLAATLGFELHAAEAPPNALDQTFSRLYNFDFAGAKKIIGAYAMENPADPMGPVVHSCIYLFSELDRLGILEGEFFADDKRLIDKKKMRPDPQVRDQLYQALGDTKAKADRILLSKPNDETALFALAISQGVLTDYLALVEKKQMGSLDTAKESNLYAQRLLRENPRYIDAYLTTGLNEYLLGSLPFFVKWFIRFDNIDGSKMQGIENLMLVAKSGRYLRPFAKILLAIIYMREKKPAESEKLISELTVEFPENPLLKKELAKIRELNRSGGKR